jgi:Gluconate 2-dehydrogenase subunit 3
MNRRQAISRLAIILGSSFTAQTLSAMDRMGGVKSRAKLFTAFTLTETQRKIVAEVAEHIIPRTTTPGAKDAGVPAFVEMMINDCYLKPEQESFVEGLKDLEAKNFLAQSKDEQITTLKMVENNTKEMMKALNVKQVKVGDKVDKETMDKKKGVPFWRLMKELTLLGYYTSEQGLKASFVYEPIPGKFEAIKIKEGQKAFYH